MPLRSSVTALSSPGNKVCLQSQHLGPLRPLPIFHSFRRSSSDNMQTRMKRHFCVGSNPTTWKIVIEDSSICLFQNLNMPRGIIPSFRVERSRGSRLGVWVHFEVPTSISQLSINSFLPVRISPDEKTPRSLSSSASTFQSGGSSNSRICHVA